MTNRWVVVFGCSGFVGSHITKALLQKGYSVRGTCRNPTETKDRFGDHWICRTNQFLELKEFAFPIDGSEISEDSIDEVVKDCDGIFMCVGHEKQDPTTIDFMVNNALSVLKASKRSEKKPVVILTSSTGSTNLPGSTPGSLKNETDFWSDPDIQKAAGKFSPAAKTLMEIKSLEFVGRNKQNEIIMKEISDSSPRLCILNPSLVLGPLLHQGELKGNGLPWFVKIINGKAMNTEIPNDSMSIISVSDLALLHVACLENSKACGRYFGVVQSWTWEEILTMLKTVFPEYKVPPKNFAENAVVTMFDNSRRDTLLAGAYGSDFALKNLQEILEETIDSLRELKHI